MGKMIISLDFELFWGIHDLENSKSFEKSIFGVHSVLPKMLEMFDKYKVDVTFATVGFLFASNEKEIKSYLPDIKPNYKDKDLSPYNYISKGEMNNQLFFGDNLISLIKEYPKHELASHTFSHYYCLELGQDIESFREDLKAAVKIAKSKNIELTSIVFPRNQVNKEYLNICYELGIKSYRGNENNWFHSPNKQANNTILKRIVRLLDSYINISGHNCYSLENQLNQRLLNLPSSRFFRAYSNRLRFLESLKLNRIKKSMIFAAKNDKIFHLWWHPHNFGENQKENLKNLENILKLYKKLNLKYSFQSVTMNKLTNESTNRIY